jgi:hypothetical protein
MAGESRPVNEAQAWADARRRVDETHGRHDPGASAPTPPHDKQDPEGTGTRPRGK